MNTVELDQMSMKLEAVVQQERTIEGSMEQDVEKYVPEQFNEHNYSKVLSEDDPVPMETAHTDPSEERTILSLLSEDKDSFETILLQLLQSFTEFQRKSNQTEKLSLLPLTGLPGTMDISTQALGSLSHEQILSIVTSSSVNNEVVKQIQAQRHLRKSPDPQQLLQLTPAQMQDLQSHMAGLLNEGKINMPNDLSSEQQMEYIRSVLVQQINLAQSNEPPTPKKSKPAKAKVVAPASKRRPKEPQKPPLPYNLFFAEVYPTVAASKPKITVPEASKIITNIWEGMTEEVKKGYYDRHEKLEKNYQQEIAAFLAPANRKDSPIEDHVSSPPSHVTPITATDAAPLKTEPGASEINSQENSTAHALVNINKILNSACDSNGLCVTSGCEREAVFSEERGPMYCSNDCVVKHCRAAFSAWIVKRKLKG